MLIHASVCKPAVQKKYFYWIFKIFLLFLSEAIASVYRHEVLDRLGNFHLHWKVDKLSEKITFKIEVQTHGYVALGLSPNGGMAGSDIAFGWVHNGKAHLQDRYAHEKGIPNKDEHQDWELLDGFENSTHTVLTFSRKFDTCDHEDFPITNDTSRVIYAYHEEDPISEDIFMYHGKENRGSKSLVLLQPELTQSEFPDHVHIWYIRSPNITIPDDVDTTYWCKIIKAPLLNRKHHVIQVKPLIADDRLQYIHHMVLYRCLGATARELEPHVHHIGHPCYVPDMPQTYTKCESVYAAWGVGGRTMVMPDSAGLPLGDKPNLYFLLEIHYDNNEYHSGVVDQSGFEVYYTPYLRRYDAMTLMVGASVDPCVVIPPGKEKFVIAGHADPLCLGPEIPPEGIRLFAVFLHSHLLGRQMKLRHFRKNVELPFIVADERYDFNYQDYRYLTEEVVVKPGDHLVVECTYDSTGRKSTTFGGLGTGQEMCLAFILYYPRIAIARSLSNAPCDLVKSLAGMDTKASNLDDDNSNYSFYQHFHTHDPWDSSYARIAEAAMRFGYHRAQCFMSDGRRVQKSGFVTYPHNLQVSNKPSRCESISSTQEDMADSRHLSFSLSSSSSTQPTIIVFSYLFLLHRLVNCGY